MEVEKTGRPGSDTAAVTGHRARQLCACCAVRQSPIRFTAMVRLSSRMARLSTYAGN